MRHNWDENIEVNTVEIMKTNNFTFIFYGPWTLHELVFASSFSNKGDVEVVLVLQHFDSEGTQNWQEQLVIQQGC